ncbi:MAG: ORF6N domain-containing protein [Elusimicrobiota bacterium]
MGVTTGNLNETIKGNIERFPADFMSYLTSDEYNSLCFQLGILKRGQQAEQKNYIMLIIVCRIKISKCVYFGYHK